MYALLNCLLNCCGYLRARWNKENVCCSQVIHQFKIATVMRSHCQVSCVSINNWTLHLCIWVNSAVNTVSNSQIISCHTDRWVLTFVNRACLIHCCNHDRTVDTVAYLHILNISINVYIRVFTSKNTDILILYLNWISDCNAFIEAIHVDYLIFIFIWTDHLQ
jgi:hypothetical protein